METNKYTEHIPFAAVHPTEIVKDEIKARGMSQKELAFRMGMKTSNLSRMLKGENITPAIAAKLELALDIPSEFWLNLQSQYEIDSKNVAIRDEQEAAAIKKERILSDILNLPELYKRLSIHPSLFIQDKLSRLEEMLGFPALEIDHQQFIVQTRYKKSDKLDIEEKNQTTWLLLAYIASRRDRPKAAFSRSSAKDAAMEIARMTHKGGIKEMDIKNILYSHGISYQVVTKLEKTPIDAVAIQMTDYPAIVVTHRYNDMSKLIFNVLHELGHIALHMDGDKETIFISSDETYSRENKLEKEANRFAEDILIPRETWSKMMSAGTKSLSNQYILKRLAQLSSDYHLNYHIVVERYRHESNRYGIGVKGVAIG